MKFCELPRATAQEDQDVKFCRVFPWAEYGVLIRVFPHFTGGGAQSLGDFLKENIS